MLSQYKSLFKVSLLAKFLVMNLAVFNLLPISAALATGGILSTNAQNIIGNGAQITWSTDTASDSLVYYGTATGSYSQSSSNRCDNGGMVTAHCVNLSNLNPSTQYFYIAISHTTSTGTTASLTSPEQNFTSASAPSGSAGANISLTPTGLMAQTVTSSQVVLTWTPAPFSSLPYSFRIFRNGVVLGNSSTPSFTDTAVASGVNYVYAVAWLDQNNVMSPLSGNLSVTIPGSSSGTGSTPNITATSTPDTTPPTPPTNVTATVISANQINVMWTAATDNIAVANYKVYLNGNLYNTILGTNTGFGFNGLTPATKYSFYIVAADAVGNISGPSNTVSATTLAASISPTPTPTPVPSTTTPTIFLDTQAPTVPQNVSAALTPVGQVYVYWNASSDNIGVTGYAVYRNGSFLATSTNTSFVDSKVIAGTSYAYKVAAFDAAKNSSGQSAPANIATVVYTTTPNSTSTPNTAPAPVPNSAPPVITTAPVVYVVVSGKVIDASGAPVANAGVSISPAAGSSGANNNYSGLTDLNGAFSLSVATGSYNIGVDPYPTGRTDLLAPSPQSLNLSSGNNQTINLQFLSLAKSSKIVQGNIMFGSSDPVTDAQVNAYNQTTQQVVSGQSGSDGSYSLALSSGSWKLTYRPINSATAQWQWPGTYQDVIFSQDNSAQTLSYNFTVPKMQTTLTVQAVDDQGNVVAGAGVALDKNSLASQTSATASQAAMFKTSDSSGTVTFLTSGGNYYLRGSISSASNLINPAEQPVQIIDGQNQTVKLVFRLVSVTNTINVLGKVNLADGSLVGGAQVWAWADGGGSVQGITNSYGAFTIALASGKTWHIGASKNISNLPYKAAETAISPSVGQSVTLSLIPISSTELPPAVTVTQSSLSQPVVGQTSNGAGVVIPSGSTGVSGITNLQINPTVEVPTQANAYVVGAAYDIKLKDQSGQNISQFSKTIQIILPYSDADIQKAGGNIKNVVPSYYSESAGTWVKIDDFTIDQAKKVFIVRVNHLTRFALVQPASVLPPNPPTALTVWVSGQNQVSLSWKDPAVDFHHTRVFRQSGNSASVLVADLIYNGTYTDSNVSVGQTYSYTLQAVDAAGNQSAISTGVPITVTDQVQQQPVVAPGNFASGDLVNDAGTIYLIYGNSKIAFTSLAAFKGLGYKLGNVLTGDASNYLFNADFQISSAKQAHPWGSWIKIGATTYYNSPDGLIKVPTKKIFLSNGGKNKYLLKANSADLKVYKAHKGLPPLSLNDSRIQ